jgi:hypothetical protein
MLASLISFLALHDSLLNNILNIMIDGDDELAIERWEKEAIGYSVI